MPTSTTIQSDDSLSLTAISSRKVIISAAPMKPVTASDMKLSKPGPEFILARLSPKRYLDIASPAAASECAPRRVTASSSGRAARSRCQKLDLRWRSQNTASIRSRSARAPRPDRRYEADLENGTPGSAPRGSALSLLARCADQLRVWRIMYLSLRKSRIDSQIFLNIGFVAETSS